MLEWLQIASLVKVSLMYGVCEKGSSQYKLAHLSWFNKDTLDTPLDEQLSSSLWCVSKKYKVMAGFPWPYVAHQLGIVVTDVE